MMSSDSTSLCWRNFGKLFIFPLKQKVSPCLKSKMENLNQPKSLAKTFLSFTVAGISNYIRVINNGLWI